MYDAGQLALQRSRFYKRSNKGRAMVKDSIVNCDETWCKVKVNRHFLKKYVWCLVNKEQKIVIYCYEDGSRGGKVLKGILKDREVKALQSDGYNVYMYIDKELVATEHHGKCIGCLSYAALNMLNERAVCSGISQEILPRNCQR